MDVGVGAREVVGGRLSEEDETKWEEVSHEIVSARDG